MAPRYLRLPAGLALIAALLVALLFALLSGKPSPLRGEFISHTGSKVVRDELVVQFRDGISEAQRAQILASASVEVDRETLADGFVVVKVPEQFRETVGQALAQTDAVVVAEEIFGRELAAAPNDPSYPDQWHLKMIHVSQAHDVTMGAEEVIVAVIDTGVAFENYTDPDGRQFALAPDLVGVNFVSPRNMLFERPDERWDHPNDDGGHGTHVTGTIAQTTNNGIATAGIAPNVSIMPVKVCMALPSGPADFTCLTDKIANGIVYAVDSGAHIINLSIASNFELGITTQERAALEYARSAGVTVIGAAGNGGLDLKGDSNVGYPAAVPSVISVGAVGIAGIRSYYSNYGLKEDGTLIDLVGPGGDPPIGPNPNEGPTSYVFQQSYASCKNHEQEFTEFFVTSCAGTSMAAAHVSGVAALIKSRFPSLIPSQIRSVLRCSADDLGPPGPDFNYGHGLVQASKSLADVDKDNIPDCIDTDLSTPSPTPVPPVNECGGPSLTPTASATPTPTQSGPTPTASPIRSVTASATLRPTGTPTPAPSETELSAGVDTLTPPATDTPTPFPDTDTPTASPTDTPTTAPTETPPPSDTPTDSPVGTDTQTPAPTETPTLTPTLTPTATGSPTPSPTPRGIQCGDVDCSGAVNGADSLGVLRWIAQVSPVAGCIGKGYVNCDAMLDALDAVTILRFSGGLPLHLPANCPGIG